MSASPCPWGTGYHAPGLVTPMCGQLLAKKHGTPILLSSTGASAPTCFTPEHSTLHGKDTCLKKAKPKMWGLGLLSLGISVLKVALHIGSQIKAENSVLCT